MFHAQREANHKNTFFCVPHYSHFMSIVKESTRLKIHHTVPASFRDKTYSDVKKTAFHIIYNVASGGKPTQDLEKKFVEIVI